jgi:hypothetical protein
MAEYGLHHSVKVMSAVATQAAVATINGTAIDMVQSGVRFESIEYCIAAGTITAGTSNVVLEQSPDDGSGSPTGVWTAVPAADLLGAQVTMDATNDAVYRCGSIGKERHQRITIPETTTFTSFEVTVVAVLGNPTTIPVADQV